MIFTYMQMTYSNQIHPLYHSFLNPFPPPPFQQGFLIVFSCTNIMYFNVFLFRLLSFGGVRAEDQTQVLARAKFMLNHWATPQT
jgi:hypothetical protein